HAGCALRQLLLDFEAEGTIITSTYLGFNSPEAFADLLTIPGVDVHIYQGDSRGFHAKGYVFRQEKSTTAIVGSSNLTEFALLKNTEWNLKFSALPDGDIVHQLDEALWLQREGSTPLTEVWLEDYRRVYEKPVAGKRLSTREQNLLGVRENEDFSEVVREVQPNSMQEDALSELAKLRERGERKGLIVSATGTGKTV